MARPIDPVREHARENGFTRYISARRACPKGHRAQRYVINSQCCVCADIARANRLGMTYVPAEPRVAAKPKRKVTSTVAPVRTLIVVKPPVLTFALSAYHNSTEARARSRHLDRLISNVTRVRS